MDLLISGWGYKDTSDTVVASYFEVAGIASVEVECRDSRYFRAMS
jgi:hypothetical protein